MSADKFTAGPWSTYVNANADMTIRKMFADGRDEACEIARCKSGFANGRLIAAAPSMLDALRLALPYVEQHGPYEHVETLLQAIQDATGAPA